MAGPASGGIVDPDGSRSRTMELLSGIIQQATEDANVLNQYLPSAAESKKAEISGYISNLQAAIASAKKLLERLASGGEKPAPVPDPNPDPNPVQPEIDPAELKLAESISNISPLIADAIAKLKAIADKQGKLKGDLDTLDTDIDKETDSKSPNIAKLKSDLSTIQDDLNALGLMMKIETDELFIPILNVLGQDVAQLNLILSRVNSFADKYATELGDLQKRNLNNVIVFISNLKSFLDTDRTAHKAIVEQFETLKREIDDLIRETDETLKKQKRAKTKKRLVQTKGILGPIIINNNNILGIVQSILKELPELQKNENAAAAARKKSKENFFSKVSRYNKILQGVKSVVSVKIESMKNLEKSAQFQKLAQKSEVVKFVGISEDLIKLNVQQAKNLDSKSLLKLNAKLADLLKELLTIYGKLFGLNSAETKNVSEFLASSIRSLTHTE